MIRHFLGQHEAIDILVGYWIFASVVSGMPNPKEASSMFYLWAYNSLHVFAGNLTTAFPSLTSKKLE